jgi:Peptidase inhibitor family I36
MTQHVRIVVIACAATLLAAASAQAQWGRSSHPSRGACFFEDANYEGRYFCASVGRDAATIPIDANDRINSVRIYGSVDVTVYKDGDFRGQSRRITSSVSNLGWVGWGNRISSYRIEERSYGNTSSGWGGAYGGGGWGGSGTGHSDGWGGAYGSGSRSNWDNSHGGRWTYGQAQDIVRRAYRSVLRRDPDPGAQSWVNAVMKNNWTQAQLEAELMKSAEYRNRR